MTLLSDTKMTILAAAKQVLLDAGYRGMSTRRVAESAGVPLSQIHYHFGSRRNLVLALLEAENERLLERQSDMFQAETSLSDRWDQACDYLEADLASGYVRLLQEMTAAGWADAEIAKAVRRILRGWFDLLTHTAEEASSRLGGLGPFSPREVAVLAGIPFLGIESMILLGFDEDELPSRSALRKVGVVLRAMESGR